MGESLTARRVGLVRKIYEVNGLSIRKYPIFIGAATFIPAAAVFAVRLRWQVRGFENIENNATLVPKRGGTEAWLLLAIILAFAAIAVGCAVYAELRLRAPGGYAGNFRPLGGASSAVAVVCGCAIAAAGLAELLGTAQPLSLGLLTFAGGAAIAVSPLFRRNPTSILFLVLSTVPELFFVFWLVLTFRTNQTNPYIIAYAPKAVALAASTGAFYFIAGNVYGRSRRLFTTLSMMLAVFACAATLADGLADDLFPVTELVVFMMTAVYLAFNLIKFSANLREKPPEEPLIPNGAANETD
ncbi:MAG: hypothetical protein LBS90_05600 [Oscillospiraceae bacterium]|jgi:hypothetical protein|nr:hypothetical protein [Oscillospiraceae bacterium]